MSREKLLILFILCALILIKGTVLKSLSEGPLNFQGRICHDRGIEIGNTVIVAEGKNNEEAYDENT